MSRPSVLPLFLLLAACASPSPEFFGANRAEVTVDGRAFTVLRRESRVQVIRHGYASPRDRRAIPRRAKVSAVLAMSAGVGFTWFTVGWPWVLISLAVLAIAGTWICTRNE